MAEGFRKLGITAAFGALIMAGGLGGCSALSSNHVDCNVVKLQGESGRSDAEIASAVGASVADVESCHGSSESSGGRTPGASIPMNY